MCGQQSWLLMRVYVYKEVWFEQPRGEDWVAQSESEQTDHNCNWIYYHPTLDSSICVDNNLHIHKYLVLLGVTVTQI